jgi:hypothetical protein
MFRNEPYHGTNQAGTSIEAEAPEPVQYSQITVSFMVAGVVDLNVFV